MTGSISTTADRLADLHDRLARRVGRRETGDPDGRPGNISAARPMIERLLDAGSFVELDILTGSSGGDQGDVALPGDTVVTGHGTIGGRAVCVYGMVPADGAAPGRVDYDKVVKVIDLALTTGRPIIGITAAADGRLDDGMAGLGAFGQVLARTIAGSGVVPQISVIVGPTSGGQVFVPALADFVVMVRGSSLALSDPAAITTVTGQVVAAQDFGGADTHLRRSGLAHHVADDEVGAIDFVRELLEYLPNNNQSVAPRTPPLDEDPDEDARREEDLELDTLMPDSSDLPYDVREVIWRVLDDGVFLEVQAGRAPNIITGLGRVDGHSVGVVANQPLHLAGFLDIDAAEKAARFVRTCDTFNVPVLTLVDAPGFLPSDTQEQDGLIRRSAKLLHAYGEASVPKITVVLRKAYGAAYHTMGSKQLGADVSLAWPTASIAPMAASAAVERVFADRLRQAAERGQDLESLLWHLQTEYEDEHVNPYDAAGLGHLDAVIAPSDTRGRLAAALRLVRSKMVVLPARKHGNIPL